jgi:hypothetical protein
LGRTLSAESMRSPQAAAWSRSPIRQRQPLDRSAGDQFPSVTLSFNLAPNTTIGAAVSAVQSIAEDLHMPPSDRSQLAGQRACVSELAQQHPHADPRGLVAIYLILGMLYESTTHPLTIISTWPSAGLGALLTHMLVGTPLDVIGIVGIILLIGIVKKNGIMLVDFALAEGRETRAEQRGRHPPGMSDAVPPNPDDDAGRAALERAPFAQDGNRIGNSPAARLCDCRCSVHLAAADACHHTDRLHQHGPTKRLDGTTAPRNGGCRPCGLARQ